jgi:outer membrane lipoprotein SlyB
MYRKLVSIIVIMIFMTVTFGCASIPEQHKGAATGAGIGAATGAVAGALLGSSGAKTEMALLGGLVGALAGGVIGHYAYDKKKSSEETAAKYKYKTSQGMMIRIEDAFVYPVMVRPGETVDLKMTYAVLGVPAGQEVSIKEIREIRYKGEIYGKPQTNVTREDGTYTSVIPLTLPPDAKSGKYSVIMTVETSKMSDSKEVSFSVR